MQDDTPPPSTTTDAIADATTDAATVPTAVTALDAPVAPTEHHVWHRPTGDTVDEYAWMRNTDDRRFVDVLEAENRHAAGWFAPHRALIDTLFDEIRSRVRETDMSTPVRNGAWWYVTSTEQGESYPRHHRGPSAENAAEHLLLDENVEAAGHDFFDLGAFDASHDHSHIAWSADTEGRERYRLRIRRVDADGTSTDLDDVIDGVSNAGIAWTQDATRLYYVRPDEQERPFQVWRHRVGDADASDDVMVFEERDQRFFVQIGETRSNVWIVIHSGSQTSSEVRLIPSGDPNANPTVVAPRREDVEYQVDDWGDRLVMLTNAGHSDDDPAEDFRVRQCASTDEWTDPANWTELDPHVAGRRIIGIEAFESHLLVYEWADAQPRLRLIFRDLTERSIDLGRAPHDVVPGANPEWSTDTVRFAVQSMTSPPTLFDEDVRSSERTLLRRMPTPNVDLDQYVSERIWAHSTDGTLVPLDIVRHVDTPVDGTAAGCLYGYGAYEASMAPWFSVARLSLLDRGMVWALAHPRGGGELGRRWYLDGKFLAKQNSFDDMAACADELVRRGSVAGDRLALRGGSAGGLLVGACAVQRPERYTAVVAEVPFVDVVTTMSDPTLPLTVTEWEEWGDPRREPYASAMLAYSPYDNTVAADYPAMYVTAGLHDPRVAVHEPAKWVARLRSVTTGDAAIVLHTEMDAGHGGPTGRYDAWRDEAQTLAFLLVTTS